MSITTLQLTIVQGATFRQTFPASLSDQGIADIQAFAIGSNGFQLSTKLKGDTGNELVVNGAVSIVVNDVTISLTEAQTTAIGARKGRFNVEVSNGVDRWRIGEGQWRNSRDTT